MKRYKIRILLNSGTTSWFEAEVIISNLINSSGDKYIFRDDQGLHKFYPAANTIIEELASEKVTLEI
jgi:hypothetical protein